MLIILVFVFNPESWRLSGMLLFSGVAAEQRLSLLRRIHPDEFLDPDRSSLLPLRIQVQNLLSDVARCFSVECLNRTVSVVQRLSQRRESSGGRVWPMGSWWRRAGSSHQVCFSPWKIQSGFPDELWRSSGGAGSAHSNGSVSNPKIYVRNYYYYFFFLRFKLLICVYFWTGARVRPICLPLPDVDIPPQTSCIVGGWGRTKESL